MTIVRNKYGFTVLALITKTNIKNTSVIRTQKTKKKKKIQEDTSRYMESKDNWTPTTMYYYL